MAAAASAATTSTSTSASSSSDDPPGPSTLHHQPHHHHHHHHNHHHRDQAEYIADFILSQPQPQPQPQSQSQSQSRSRSRPASPLTISSSCPLTAATTNPPYTDSTSSSSIIAGAGAGTGADIASTSIMPFSSAPPATAGNTAAASAANEPAVSTTTVATAADATTASSSSSSSSSSSTSTSSTITSSKQRSCSKHVAGGNSKRQDFNSLAFILPPPSSHFRHSSHYPLANATTPQHIRDFSFNVGDTPVRFQELDVNKHHPDSNVTYQLFTLPSSSYSSNLELPQTTLTSTSSHLEPPRRDSVTPVSLPEPPFPHPHPAAAPSATAAPASASVSAPASANFLSRSHALHQPRLPPKSHFADSSIDSMSRLVAESSLYPQTTAGSSSTPSPPAASSSSFPVLLSPVPRRGSRNHVQFALANNDESDSLFAPVVQDHHHHHHHHHHTPVSMDRSNQQGMLQVPAAPQIPAANHVDTATSSASASTTSNRPMMFRPSSINLSSEDVSLPSPRLSPVTATASRVVDPNSTSSLSTSSSSSADNGGTGTDNSAAVVPTDEFSDDLALQHLLFQSTAHQQHRQYSMMDIPVFVDFFESMPEKMKTYVMLQLLKRCPKTTLLPIAEVVNPALKVDFLGRLPLELSLNIIKHFDFKTMCRAACVSKKWRNIVNSDEKSWKSLFDQDGFVLAEGELERAIEEGWGWQTPSHTDGPHEQRRRASLSVGWRNSSPLRSSVVSGQFDVETSSARALASSEFGSSFNGSVIANPRKRKAFWTPLTAPGALKRRFTSSSSRSGDEGSIAGPLPNQVDLSISGNARAAANAAAMAVPYPHMGIPSLQNLHFYKSLYYRHYRIQQAWMKRDSRPLHLAFRAHTHHVVTCLQFDSEKILTGSDDTNINVYDTRTGALRTTLRGHEGGVWALEYVGNTLVSGSTDRSVRVWDIERAECTQVFQGHTSTVRCLQILQPAKVGEAPDGSPEYMPKEPLIITGSRDSTLRVWKLPGRNDPKFYQTGPAQDDSSSPFFVRTLTGHQHSVRALAAHGDTLVSGSYDTTVRVWKISTGQCLHRLQGHHMKVYSVVLDHERERCISGSMDHMVKIWCLKTGAALFTLEGHHSLVGLLDLRANLLVSAAADSTLRIWDPENGRCRSILTAHTGAITCFQHDQTKVISGSDRTLKMWDVKTGEFVKDVLSGLNGVWQVKFDDRRCVAAVQRERLTYIEVIDYGAARDGCPEEHLGRRIIVNTSGEEIEDPDFPFAREVA